MLKRLWTAVLAAGLVVGAAGAADEAVTIKLKKAGKGDVVKETKTEDVDTVVNISAGGQKQEQKEMGGSKLVYTEEVLEKGEKDPKPTKLKRTFETAEVKKMGKTVDLGLKGKSVVVEKGKDKYTFKMDGDGKLSDEATEIFEKEFNKKDDQDTDELMLPKKAVKVGDTWDIDAKVVAGLFGEELAVDKDKAKVSGKLVKVYEKDKAKFGVVEYTMDLPITSLKIMDQSVPASEGSKLKVTVTMDGCIDGTVFGGTSSGKMEGNVGLKVPMAEIDIKMTGTMGSKAESVKK